MQSSARQIGNCPNPLHSTHSGIDEKFNKMSQSALLTFARIFIPSAEISCSKSSMLHSLELLRQLELCNTTATTISGNGETDVFEFKAGVLQGETLTPYLFIDVLGYVMLISLNNMEENDSFWNIVRIVGTLYNSWLTLPLQTPCCNHSSKQQIMALSIVTCVGTEKLRDPPPLNHPSWSYSRINSSKELRTSNILDLT